MVILINDHWCEKEEARIDLFSDVVMYGVGLFETFRTYQGRRFFRLEDHIERLLDAAGQIGLRSGYSTLEIKNMVTRVVAHSNWELQRVKILMFSDQLIVTSSQLIPDESIFEGVGLKSVHQQRALPEFKSTSYLDCLRSYQIARDAGFYDALLVDDRGYVTEGSRSNVFWIYGNSVLTRDDGVLPGITRKVIIEDDSMNSQFKKANLETLVQADELFITNSIIGVVPVVRVDDTFIGSGKVGPLTRSIVSRYNRLHTP